MLVFQIIDKNTSNVSDSQNANNIICICHILIVPTYVCIDIQSQSLSVRSDNFTLELNLNMLGIYGIVTPCALCHLRSDFIVVVFLYGIFCSITWLWHCIVYTVHIYYTIYYHILLKKPQRLNVGTIIVCI